MKSRKTSGIKINVEKSLQYTIAKRIETLLHEDTRTTDNPVVKASIVWERLNEQIKDVLGEEIHRQWFSEIVPIVIIDHALLLKVPSMFHAKWLNSHYRKLMNLLIGFQDKNLTCFFVTRKSVNA